MLDKMITETWWNEWMEIGRIGIGVYDILYSSPLSWLSLKNVNVKHTTKQCGNGISRYSGDGRNPQRKLRKPAQNMETRRSVAHLETSRNQISKSKPQLSAHCLVSQHILFCWGFWNKFSLTRSLSPSMPFFLWEGIRLFMVFVPNFGNFLHQLFGNISKSDERGRTGSTRVMNNV